MSKRMNNSIQEYSKKINRGLSIFDIGSLMAVTLGILFLNVYVDAKSTKALTGAVYQEGDLTIESKEQDKGLPFGSKNGKTYTFSWCQGSSRILEKNKIIFATEDEALRSGRTMSKLCQR
jgi:hypothetical protein